MIPIKLEQFRKALRSKIDKHNRDESKTHIDHDEQIKWTSDPLLLPQFDKWSTLTYKGVIMLYLLCHTDGKTIYGKKPLNDGELWLKTKLPNDEEGGIRSMDDLIASDMEDFALNVIEEFMDRVDGIQS